MKKLLALVMVLCLFTFSFASAEQATVTQEDTVLTLDDFSLNLSTGMVYATQPREAEGLVIQVAPYAASGDNSSNFNFMWNGSSFDSSADTTNASVDGFRESVITALNDAGMTVDSLVFDTAADCTIAGRPGSRLDCVIGMTYQKMSFVVYQRYLFEGMAGYMITISAGDAALLDAMTELLDSILTWN